MPNVREREDFDDLVEKLTRWLPPEDILRHFKPEERIGSLPPEEVLRHFKPEERLAGLTREQQILALPDEVLRGLSAEYVQSLPQAVQDVIRQRLGKAR